MVCRDEKRGKEAQEEIMRESNNANVELHLCDMAQPQAVFAFTKAFIESKKPLSVRRKDRLDLSTVRDRVCSFCRW